MTLDPDLNKATEALSHRVDALFLAGSHGRGTADAVSDIDLLGIAASPEHAATMDHWHAALTRHLTLVYWHRPFPGLANAITSDWLRVDLFLIPVERLAGRAQSTLKPLHDPQDLWGALPETLPPAQPDPAKVLRLTNEFLRVLGLTHVGLAREEYVLLARGSGLLRDLLMDLMLETCAEPDKGGMLHPSKLLTPEHMAQLAALPAPTPTRDAVIDANLATAAVFLPLARSLLGQDYPLAFEQATRAYLERVGVALP